MARSLHSRHVRESHPEQRAFRYAFIDGMNAGDSRVHNYNHWRAV
jgi:hypothetical protein